MIHIINNPTSERSLLSLCLNDENLLVLYYDEYHEDMDLFFINGQKYTLFDAKKYIRSYFINNKQ